MAANASLPMLAPQRRARDRFEDSLRDDRLEDIIRESKEDVDDANTFRYHAPSTQERQDLHLSLYRKFVRKIHKLPDESSEEQIDTVGFPQDRDALFQNCEWFLSHVYKTVAPRSIMTGSHIEYSTLTQYRDSLMYWVSEKYRHQRSFQPPSRSELHGEMTRMMRLVIEKYPGTKGRLAIADKTFIGLPELRQLLDLEMTINTCIENSEQHQLLWLLARNTAVRPGALVQSSKGRNEPLKWRDVQFTQEGKAKFLVTVTFRNIAIKSSNDPEKSESAKISFRCRLLSPNADNLIFSVAHRWLVLALRRNAIEGIDSFGIDAVDDLLAGDKYYIQIKDEFLEQPVFLRAGNKGYGIDLDGQEPMGASNASNYLASRAETLGYTARITWYSIRRRVATDIARRLGNDAGRLLIGHKPDTDTLEEYYLEIGASYDAVGVTLDQEVGPGGNSEILARDWAPMATEALTAEAVARTTGPAMHALARQIMLQDPNAPGEDASAHEIKMYTKRAREYARRSLVAEESKRQRSNITMGQMQQRRKAFNHSRFADYIVAQASDLMRSFQATDAIDTVDEDNDDDRDAEQENPVETIDEQLIGTNTQGGVVHIDVPGEGDVETNDIDPDERYAVEASVLMYTLMTNSLSENNPWTFRRGQISLRAAGFDIEPEPRLSAPEPHQSVRGVVYGDLHDGSIPASLAGSIAVGQAQYSDHFAHVGNEVTAEPMKISDDGAPEHLRGQVEHLDRPTAPRPLGWLA